MGIRIRYCYTVSYLGWGGQWDGEGWRQGTMQFYIPAEFPEKYKLNVNSDLQDATI